MATSNDVASLLRALERLQQTAVICIGITVISVVLRLWTRAKILRKVGIDDWTIVASWACFIAGAVLAISLVQIVDNLFLGKPFDLRKTGNILKAGTSFYIASMALLKVSLGAFFLQIFSHQRIQRFVIYAIVVVTVIYSIVCGALTAASCGVSAGFLAAESSCKVWRAFNLITTSWSILNAAGDVMFAILAIDALRVAQMQRITKIYAALVLVFGTVGGVASIIRISIISSSVQERGAMQGVLSGIWTLLEMCIGITATNLACLRPLLRLVRQKLRSKLARTGSYDDQSVDEVDEHDTKHNHARRHSKVDYMLSDAMTLKSGSPAVETSTQDSSCDEEAMDTPYNNLPVRMSEVQQPVGQVPQIPPSVLTTTRPTSSYQDWQRFSLLRLSFGGGKPGSFV